MSRAGDSVAVPAAAGDLDESQAQLGWAARERRRPIIQAAARRTLRRRRLAGKLVQALCVLCAAIGLAPLVALVYYTADRGLPGISLSFPVSYTHLDVYKRQARSLSRRTARGPGPRRQRLLGCLVSPVCLSCRGAAGRQ